MAGTSSVVAQFSDDFAMPRGRSVRREGIWLDGPEIITIAFEPTGRVPQIAEKAGESLEMWLPSPVPEFAAATGGQTGGQAPTDHPENNRSNSRLCGALIE